MSVQLFVQCVIEVLPVLLHHKYLLLLFALLQDPGPIVLNTESLVQLSKVVEFDLDAVVSESE